MLCVNNRKDDRMKQTNRHGIKSTSIINALTWDDYDMSNRPENVISCTELIDAPKAKILNFRHRESVETDVSDNFWILDGRAIHYAVEMSNMKGGEERLSEERIFIQITCNGDVSSQTLNKGERVVGAKWYNSDDLFVSVKFDNYDSKEMVIEDYKRTQVWEVVFGLKPERMKQLNIGAYALKLLGFNVKLLRSVLLLKSWEKKKYEEDVRKSKQYGNDPIYPPIPYAEYEEKPWNDEGVLRFIKARADLHIAARAVSDDQIPPCTEEERWYSGESFAVMKKGNKKATKVFRVENCTPKEAELAAVRYIETQSNGNFFIEHRPGENKRCEGYCPANIYCNFYKSLHTTA